MTITLDLPDALAPALGPARSAISRTVLECFVVEAYRQSILSTAQIGTILGHSSRWETEDFLSAHDAWPGVTLEDAIEDARTLNALLK